MTTNTDIDKKLLEEQKKLFSIAREAKDLYNKVMDKLEMPVDNINADLPDLKVRIDGGNVVFETSFDPEKYVRDVFGNRLDDIDISFTDEGLMRDAFRILDDVAGSYSYKSDVCEAVGYDRFGRKQEKGVKHGLTLLGRLIYLGDHLTEIREKQQEIVRDIEEGNKNLSNKLKDIKSKFGMISLVEGD